MNTQLITRFLIERLNEDQNLKKQVSGIYTSIPVNAYYPLIILPRIRLLSDSFLDNYSTEAKLELEVMSDASSIKECSSIISTLEGVLKTQSNLERWLINVNINDVKINQLAPSHGWKGIVSLKIHLIALQ